MTQIIVAGIVAFAVSIFLTPVLIQYFRRFGYGQAIREDGPQSHQAKRGTPTMGGIAIVVGIWTGYIAAGVLGLVTVGGGGFTASGLLVLGLATALGAVGFADDGLKVIKRHNLGLNKLQKTAGQVTAAVLFGILALQFRNDIGLSPATTNLSFTRDFVAIAMPAVVFVVFVLVLIWSWSNAVNFTDGLDGLAGGSVGIVMAVYTIITFWQFRYSCVGGSNTANLHGCYQVRDPLDIAVVCAAAMGACAGFLWWNAAPAKIFMGDTGSLTLGGIVAGVSVVTQTELLMVVAGSVFVLEIVSVVIQVLSFRATGNRPFRMTPIHHHFELGGWQETTVVIRFWLLTIIACGAALAIFYGEWLSTTHI